MKANQIPGPLVMLSVSIGLLGFLPAAEERTWTNADGKQLSGELVEDKGETLVLKVKGRDYQVPLNTLSEEDRNWIAEQRKAIEEKKKEDATLAGTMKTFPSKEGQQVAFHVKYPKSYSATKPPPLLILFSTFGNGKDSVKTFQDPCDQVGWICVGCDTFKNGVDDAIQDPLFTELLPIIEQQVVHDPTRLYMGGMSGGAMRSLGYTGKFDRPWKGVVACGGWLGKRYDAEYGEKMSIAWVNGDKDTGAGSWFTSDSEFLKKKFRCKSKLFEFPGGHVVGPPEVLTEAIRWLEQEAAE